MWHALQIKQAIHSAISHLSHAMEKQTLRFLSLSYQIKDWQVGPRQSFIWYDTDYRFIICCLHILYFIVGFIPKERLMGPRTANPSFGKTKSFFWYDTDKDLKVCIPMAHLILVNSQNVAHQIIKFCSYVNILCIIIVCLMTTVIQ